MREVQLGRAETKKIELQRKMKEDLKRALLNLGLVGYFSTWLQVKTYKLKFSSSYFLPKKGFDAEFKARKGSKPVF